MSYYCVYCYIWWLWWWCLPCNFKVHVSGLIKRSLAQLMGGAAGAQNAAAKPAAKKPMATEMREE